MAGLLTGILLLLNYFLGWVPFFAGLIAVYVLLYLDMQTKTLLCKYLKVCRNALMTVLAVSLTSVLAFGQSTFQKTFGTYDDYAYEVIQTMDSGFAFTGRARSFGVGMDDTYLIKTENNGDVEWIKTYGRLDSITSGDWGRAVQQTSDGGYIIGGAIGSSTTPGSSNFLLIKTDPSGNIVWEKIYGDTGHDYGYDVKQTLDGGYIMTGHTYSYGQGSCDLYILKTDSVGTIVWTKTIGGASCDRGRALQLTSDGGYIIAGRNESTGAGSTDMWLVKLDAVGNIDWEKTYGGPNNEWANSVQQTFDGGYVVIGLTNSFGAGDNDVYVIKTDQNGDTLWTKTYGTTSHDRGHDIQQTPDSGFVFTGTMQGDYLFIIKADQNGDTLWTKQYKTGGVCRNIQHKPYLRSGIPLSLSFSILSARFLDSLIAFSAFLLRSLSHLSYSRRRFSSATASL